MLEERIRREWAALAGHALSRRSWPTVLEHGVLHVAVDNSAWLQELNLRAGEVLNALGARYGAVVTGVRPVLGRPETPASVAPVAAAGPRPGPLGPEEAECIDRLTRAIDDPDLAAAIKRLLVKDYQARDGQRPRSRPAGSSGSTPWTS
jgi:hypothetical protein